MISRVIFLSTVIGWSGFNLMPPPPPQAPTAQQLRIKAHQVSRSNICDRKKKTKTVKELCQRWEDQQKLNR